MKGQLGLDSHPYNSTDIIVPILQMGKLGLVGMKLLVYNQAMTKLQNLFAYSFTY